MVGILILIMKTQTVLYFSTQNASELDKAVERIHFLLSNGYKITRYYATHGYFIYTIEKLE